MKEKLNTIGFYINLGLISLFGVGAIMLGAVYSFAFIAAVFYRELALVDLKHYYIGLGAMALGAVMLYGAYAINEV